MSRALGPAHAELFQLLNAYADVDPFDARGATSVPWHKICRELLLICRRHEPDRRRTALTEEDVLDATVAIGSDLFSENEPKEFSQRATIADFRFLRDIADQHATILEDHGDEAALLIAHGLACAIDLIIGGGDRLLSYFRSRAPWRVTVDSLFPLPDHNPKSVVAPHSPNTNPINLPDPFIDRTRHLRLGTSDAGLPVVLDFSLWSHLSRILPIGPVKMATAQPNLSLSEFDIQWSTTANSTKPSDRWFRNQGPLDVPRQHELLVELTKKAAEAGAQVVLTGEYAYPHSSIDDLREKIFQLDGPLLLVGTADSEAHRPRNEAVFVMPGLVSPRVAVAKFFPAKLDEDLERIEPATEIAVFLTQSWSIAALICRDAMSEHFLSALGELGVNMLLVPAMTDRSGTLVANAMRLCSSSQALVAVAISPTAWPEDARRPMPGAPAVADRVDQDRVQAAFGGPYERGASPLTAPEASGSGTPLEQPALWVFDSSQRSVTQLVL